MSASATTTQPAAVSRGAQVASLLCAIAKTKPLDANAEMVYRLATEMNPEDVAAWNGYGRALLSQRKFATAREAFQEAVRLRPEWPPVLVNYAAALTHLGLRGDALHYCEKAIVADPKFIPAYRQMVAIYEENSDWRRMGEAIDAGLLEDPRDTDLLFARGCLALRMKHWEMGWALFEYRAPAIETSDRLDNCPRWEGEPFEGNLLIVCEQGLGDQIMFARYLSLIGELHPPANTIVYTRPELARLLSLQPFTRGMRFITTDREAELLDIQQWALIGSLPSIFPGPPVVNHLLLTDGVAIDRFKKIVTGSGRRIGLCWQGNPNHRHDQFRSMTMGRMMSIPANLAEQGDTFYSLQIGDKESGLLNLTDYCHDLVDTAAALLALDLVITIDSAIAHLAGALGVRTFLLNYQPGDFRWEAEWYESVQVFKSAHRGISTSVLVDVLNTLSQGAAPAAVGTAPAPELGWSIKTKDCRYGTMSYFSSDAYISRGLDLYGEFSESEVELFRKLLKRGDRIIEAGANIGCHTVAMAELVGTSGQVDAFEPNPIVAGMLMSNTQSRDWISVHGMALGSTTERVKINMVDHEQVHTPSWPVKYPPIEAQCVSIDEAFQHDILEAGDVAFMKIDVDGPEFEILKGAEKLIDRCQPIIYVENDKPEKYMGMIPWLADKGYRIYQHFAPLYNPNNFAGYHVNVYGKIVSAMLLCIPKDRYDLSDIPREFGMERILVQRR